MYKVTISQFGPLGTTGEDKDKWRRLDITLELDFIPQVGAYLKARYIDGLVKTVEHNLNYPKEPLHKVTLQDKWSYDAFSSVIKWDNLPENMTAGSIMVPHPEGGFTTQDGLDQWASRQDQS